MVYASELEAIHIAGVYAKELSNQLTKYRIFTDSQPAIKSLVKPKRQDIKQTLGDIDTLYDTSPSHSLLTAGVPGQVSIEGNERVDQAAKQAATQKINPPLQRTPLTSTRSMRSTS